MRILYLLVIILFIPSTSIAETERYFPKGTFSNDEKKPNKITIQSIDGSVLTYSSVDDFNNQYYTQLFINMKEPSLWKISQTKKDFESYRLLIEPSFSNYICVRIDLDSSEKVTVYLKIFSHDYTDENDRLVEGKLIKNITKSLSITDIKPLQKQLVDINLWNMKEEDFQLFDPKTNEISTDGNIYFFEHVKDNKYQAIEVPVPNYGPIDNNVLYKIAHFFTDLAENHKE